MSKISPLPSRPVAPARPPIEISRRSAERWKPNFLGGTYDPRMFAVTGRSSPPLIDRSTSIGAWTTVTQKIKSSYSVKDQKIFDTALAVFMSLGRPEAFYRGLSRCSLLAHWGCKKISIVAAGLLADISVETLEIAGGSVDGKVIDLLKQKRFLDTYRFERGSREERKHFINMFLMLENDPEVHLLKAADEYIELREESEKAKHQARHSGNITAVILKMLEREKTAIEMQDMAFCLSDPEKRQEIDVILREKRMPQEKLEALYGKVDEALNQSGEIPDKISYKIQDIPKTHYSIARKIERGEELSDLNRFRIILGEGCSEEDCYTVGRIARQILLGEGWTRIREEEGDYLKKPKKNNGYRTLHQFYKKGNYSLEIQIRTEKMHAEAEAGKAAHWRYQEKDFKHATFPAQLRHCRQSGRIYVLDINNGIYRLVPRPMHANDHPITALDFAFAKHVGLGCHCPEMVEIQRIDKGTGDIIVHFVPRSDAVQNGDRIIIRKRRHELRAAEIDESLQYVATLAAYNALQLLKEEGIDEAAREARGDRSSRIGGRILRAEIDALKIKLRNEAKRKFPRKFQRTTGPLISFSLRRAIEEVSPRSKEDLYINIGLNRNSGLINTIIRKIRDSHSATYYRQEGRTATLWTLLRNESWVPDRLGKLLKKQGLTTVGKMAKSVRKSLLLVRTMVTFKKQEDFEAALSDLDNLFDYEE